MKLPLSLFAFLFFLITLPTYYFVTVGLALHKPQQGFCKRSVKEARLRTVGDRRWGSHQRGPRLATPLGLLLSALLECSGARMSPGASIAACNEIDLRRLSRS